MISKKEKTRVVGNTIDQPIPKHKFLISIPAKKKKLYTKEKIHPFCNIYINTLYLQILIVIVSKLAHSYLYSFIHPYIKSNSNSTINSAVKSQFGLQYNFKFALLCNTTALQMSSITPL